jgi:hypothetical protein
MRRIFLALALLFSLTAAAPVPAPQRFLLLYSNDVHGETEPCG